MSNDESKERVGRRHSKAVDLRNGRLFAALFGVMWGAVGAAAGMGRLFISDDNADPWARALLAAGAIVLMVSAMSALRILRELPAAQDDCTRYGRHIVGLTFVLLVMGLCNAAGMSVLALEGGLDFSAESLVAASDTTKVTKADAVRVTAANAEKNAERELRTANKALARARTAEAAACKRPALPANTGVELYPGSVQAASVTSSAAGNSDLCAEARSTVESREDALDTKRDQLLDAREQLAATEKGCAEVRLTKKRGLFFLLSVSTITSLLGAAFYVVNQVRGKRPPYTPPSSESAPGGGSELESAQMAGSNQVATVTATALVQAVDEAEVKTGAAPAGDTSPKTSSSNGEVSPAPAPATVTAHMSFPMSKTAEEPFDVHKFWSGTFFRVGEAVLFTFTFFWLLWSSRRTEYAIWLPVLALFVGMFVKTGETVIFRLGMRILSAAEALLPAGPPARGEHTEQTGERATASGTASSVTLRDGRAQAVAS